MTKKNHLLLMIAYQIAFLLLAGYTILNSASVVGTVVMVVLIINVGYYLINNLIDLLKVKDTKND